MHPANYTKPPDVNESGKFAHVPVAGVRRIDNHGYKLHKYEISSREVGLTVKRKIFSVTIEGEAGERLTFLTDLPSSLAAKKAAEAWIDQNIRRRPRLHRLLKARHFPTPTAPPAEAPHSHSSQRPDA